MTFVSVDADLPTTVVLRRLLQAFLDRLLLFVGAFVLIVGALFLTILELRAGWPRFALYLPVALFVLLAFGGAIWVDVWMPYRNGGATPAMRWLGLRIVTLTGEPPRLRDYVVRWLLLVVDGLLLGIVGAVLIAVTEHHQRLGDLVARTLVVRVS
jgi:uncharacterized RDD family membrane protein YckC